MPKPGNRAANRLVIRFVTARLKAATQRLRNRIRRTGATRIARSKMNAMAIVVLLLTIIGLAKLSEDRQCNYAAKTLLTALQPSVLESAPLACKMLPDPKPAAT